LIYGDIITSIIVPTLIYYRVSSGVSRDYSARDVDGSADRLSSLLVAAQDITADIGRSRNINDDAYELDLRRTNEQKSRA